VGIDTRLRTARHATAIRPPALRHSAPVDRLRNLPVGVSRFNDSIRPKWGKGFILILIDYNRH
jgi:hypothetical protein